MRLCRSDIFRLASVSALTLAWLPSPPAAAYDMDTAFALASLIQLRTDVAATDALLFSGELRERGPTSAVEGIRSAAGADARARVKRLLRQYKPRDQGSAAAAASYKAGLLTRRQSNEAEAHAREAAERLAAVVEFDAFDDLKADYSSKLAALDTPEKLGFVHRALVSAQEELDAVFFSFGEAERAEALRFVGGAYTPDLPARGGDGGSAGSAPGLLFPGMPGYVYAATDSARRQAGAGP